MWEARDNLPARETPGLGAVAEESLQGSCVTQGAAGLGLCWEPGGPRGVIGVAGPPLRGGGSCVRAERGGAAAEIPALRSSGKPGLPARPSFSLPFPPPPHSRRQAWRPRVASQRICLL